MVKRLAVIPARGGSKRIPRKNIRDFCGKPMIGHILETARASRLFDVIHVSTEDAEISAMVDSLGFRPDFTRPASLAADATPIVPVVKAVAETYVAQGGQFDEVWLLMACAPLLEAGDLEAGATLFAGGGGHAVLYVTSSPTPIERAFRIDSAGFLAPVAADKLVARSQDLPETYFDSGTCAIFSAQHILDNKGAMFDGQFIPHVLPRYKAIDIDTEEDWEMAEAVFLGLGKMKRLER
jgi:N-acylneuraminate cytidylyltransferase